MKATVIHRSLATGITRHVAVIEANTLAGLKAVATRTCGAYHVTDFLTLRTEGGYEVSSRSSLGWTDEQEGIHQLAFDTLREVALTKCSPEVFEEYSDTLGRYMSFQLDNAWMEVCCAYYWLAIRRFSSLTSKQVTELGNAIRKLVDIDKGIKCIEAGRHIEEAQEAEQPQDEKEAAGLEQATAQDTTTEERTFLFVRHSANAKTGDIPQIYTDKESCPVTCPIKDECYGRGHYTDKAWKRTHLKLSELAQELAKIPAGTLVRHNVAGDMAITGTGKLDISLVQALAEAFKGLKAYTYTHCQLTAEAVQAIKEAQGSGLLINASCENLAQVLKAKALGINAVMVVPEAPEAPVTYQDGIKLVQCPAEWQGITCKECGLCAKDREAVVTFTAHGQKKKALAGKLTEQPITFFRKS